jgi:FlaG/FlaF family flagellin (archaellin)
MPGAVLIVIAMVLVIPVAIMLAGAIWSAIIGWLASDEADAVAARAGETAEEPSA